MTVPCLIIFKTLLMVQPNFEHLDLVQGKWQAWTIAQGSSVIVNIQDTDLSYWKNTYVRKMFNKLRLIKD